uniref:Uncharacterized protein n=1 Tax=Arcella intermedia TaxID=1963864 RepID=A0A6B2KWS6_9EUKA
MFVKGYHKPLTQGDIPDLWYERDDPVLACENLEKYWNEETAKPKPSLLKALLRASKKPLIQSGLLCLIETAFTFCGPLLLEQIILFVANPEAPLWQGLVFCISLFIGLTIQLLAGNTHYYIATCIGIRMESALLRLIFKKALAISTSSVRKTSVGEIVNYQSVDCYPINNIFKFIHATWSAPLQVIVIFSLLGRLNGVSSLGVVAFFVVFFPMLLYAFNIAFEMEKKLMQLRDERNGVMNEILQGILVIKFFAWEDSFLKKISAIRAKEINCLKRGIMSMMFTNVLWTVGPTIMAGCVFLIYLASHEYLSSDVAFSSIALINNLNVPLTIFPVFIGNFLQATISIGRLSKFFLEGELDQEAVQSHSHNGLVRIKDATFAWDDTPILSNITLSFKRNHLTAIVGEVGSGKSSLVHAILGEMHKVSGSVEVNGSVAYVSQQPWLLNATLRDNVLFGKPFEEERYNNTIEVSELLADLKMLPGGDLTEIGEKGINLSGGQKQRVAIARAIYANADIYLFDDPLSALDAHVGKSVFQNCFLGVLRDKTCILVTHQLQYLKDCDQIISLSKGMIGEIGTYEELVSSGGVLSALIAKYVKESKEEEEETQQNDKKDKKAGNEEEGSLMTKELKEEGGVSWRIYWSYVQYVGGLLVASAILLAIFGETALVMTANYWLSFWTEMTQHVVNDTFIFPPNSLFPVETHNGLRSWYFLMVYFLILLGSCAFTTSYVVGFSLAVVKASRSIHESTLASVFRAPMYFFDTTPLGRILNRFVSDQFSIDMTLPFTIIQVVLGGTAILSILTIVASVTPLFLLILIPLVFFYRYLQLVYLGTSRELQRFKSMSRSPIYSLFTETIMGITTIRAYHRQPIFNTRQIDLIQHYLRPTYLIEAGIRWLAVRLEFISTVVVTFSGLLGVLSRGLLDEGRVGLSISYALMLSVNLSWFLRLVADLENALVSVERCVEYTRLPSEAPKVIEGTPPKNWPSAGEVIFEDVVLRYRPGLPTVLNKVSFRIKPTQKIGVVGRTGAGKSSLMLSIFRIVEAESGRIIIDGEDISNLGLDSLRKKIAMIPQSPTIYSGTIRSNLDPFTEYTDEELWEAIEATHLSEQINNFPEKLEASVSEGGTNLSVGTKQLMCLARALLKKSKILIMDEATANVDYETDVIIQTAIKKSFANATVITVAHRINTILHYDKVMVMEKGKIVEFKNPQKLLENPDSIFSSLAKESGIKNLL